MSLVDDHVGTIVGTLAEQQLADDSGVIVTSDHGDMLGERGLWYKMAPFEDSIRVPLIAHAPGRFGARRIATPVSLLDVAPTLAAMAGGGLGEVDGRSLLPALERGDLEPRDVVVEY